MYDEQNHSFQCNVKFSLFISSAFCEVIEIFMKIFVPLQFLLQNQFNDRACRDRDFISFWCKNQSTKTHSNVFCSLKIRSKHEEFLWQLSTWRIWHPHVCIMEIQTKWFSSAFEIWHFKEQCYEQVAFKLSYCWGFLSTKNLIQTLVSEWFTQALVFELFGEVLVCHLSREALNSE